MPCCGDREKIGQMKLEQTWDYIVSAWPSNAPTFMIKLLLISLESQ